MYIAMRMIVMVLIVIALLSTASCTFSHGLSCEGLLETPQGKLAVVALVILAAGKNIICGLAVVMLFIVLTNTHREGFCGSRKTGTYPTAKNSSMSVDLIPCGDGIYTINDGTTDYYEIDTNSSPRPSIKPLNGASGVNWSCSNCSGDRPGTTGCGGDLPFPNNPGDPRNKSGGLYVTKKIQDDNCKKQGEDKALSSGGEQFYTTLSNCEKVYMNFSKMKDTVVPGVGGGATGIIDCRKQCVAAGKNCNAYLIDEAGDQCHNYKFEDGNKITAYCKPGGDHEYFGQLKYTDDQMKSAKDLKFDKETLLNQPAYKRAFNKKVCDPRWAQNSSQNRAALVEMTDSIDITLNRACNPCDKTSDCNYTIHAGKGADQLEANQLLKPQSENDVPNN